MRFSCARVTPGSGRDFRKISAIKRLYLILDANLVCDNEIRKTYQNNERECLLWYYRDKDCKEIDVVMEQDGRATAA